MLEGLGHVQVTCSHMLLMQSLLSIQSHNEKGGTRNFSCLHEIPCLSQAEGPNHAIRGGDAHTLSAGNAVWSGSDRATNDRTVRQTQCLACEKGGWMERSARSNTATHHDDIAVEIMCE